jgi:hypothetical protein
MESMNPSNGNGGARGVAKYALIYPQFHLLGQITSNLFTFTYFIFLHTYAVMLILT